MKTSNPIEVRESQDWAWALQLMHDMREKVTDDASAKAMWQTPGELEGRPDLQLLEVWNGQRVGAFVLHYTGPGVADVHTMLTVGGSKAIKAGAAMLEYVFRQSGRDRVTGRCPGNNPAILHYAKLNGCRVVGHKADWVKHGKRFVSTYVELTKEEFIANQARKQLCQ